MVIKNYYWKDTTNDLGLIIHREFIIDDKVEKFDKKPDFGDYLSNYFDFEIISDISSEKDLSVFLNSLKKGSSDLYKEKFGSINDLKSCREFFQREVWKYINSGFGTENIYNCLAYHYYSQKLYNQGIVFADMATMLSLKSNSDGESKYFDTLGEGFYKMHKQFLSTGKEENIWLPDRIILRNKSNKRDHTLLELANLEFGWANFVDERNKEVNCVHLLNHAKTQNDLNFLSGSVETLDKILKKEPKNKSAKKLRENILKKHKRTITDSDGSKKIIQFIDGEENGITSFYDNEGNLEEEREYINGKINGKVKIYHKNGVLKFEVLFKDDKQVDGIVTSYDDSGILVKKSSIKNGDHNGNQIYYHKNGKVKSETMMENGEKIGPYKVYSQNGTLKQEGVNKKERPASDYGLHKLKHMLKERDDIQVKLVFSNEHKDKKISSIRELNQYKGLLNENGDFFLEKEWLINEFEKYLDGCMVIESPNINDVKNKFWTKHSLDKAVDGFILVFS